MLEQQKEWDDDPPKNCASVVKEIRIIGPRRARKKIVRGRGKRIYFFPYRRAQSLIYSNAEIAVNDICRVFHFVFKRVVQEEEEGIEDEKRNDGT